MRKITLTCGDNKINTTCEGTSQHIHNSIVIHRLSNKGKQWYDALPDDHGPITATTTTASERLDYITEAPLP
jgi:hypothetical protein